MKKPKVTIIIPIYNSEKNITYCIDSILKQDYKNFELILVNNNSKDNTKNIIKNYEKKDKRIIYCFEKIRKRGAARNTGEKFAKGSIILMTDSDCVVPKNWISEMIKPILKNEFKAVQGYWKSSNKNFLEKIYQEEKRKKYNSKIIPIPLGKIDTVNFCIKKDLLKKIGNTSRDYFSGNDTDISIKLTKNNIKVKFLKNVKVSHKHPNSLIKLIIKNIYRAKWTKIITRDNYDFLKETSFLKNTCQTPKSFLIFFPSIIYSSIKNNPKKTLYNFITGFSWRIGLLYYFINNKK